MGRVEKKNRPSPKGAPVPTRFSLDDERESRTVKFRIVAENEIVEGYFTVGLYHDGVPGELFVWVNKEGSEIHGFANAWSLAISMLLQYGIDPRKIYEKFAYADFQPNGITNLRDVPICKSIVDLIMKYMKANFPPTAEEYRRNDEYSGTIEMVVSQQES